MKSAPKANLLTSWVVDVANPHCSGLPENMPVRSVSLWVQIRLDIWIQPVYLGICYYRSSQGPPPTLPALPLWEGSSVRRAGVQSLSAWGAWRTQSWSCGPPDSLVYCLKEWRCRKRGVTVDKEGIVDVLPCSKFLSLSVLVFRLVLD